MENASNALIMAAGVLIGILILSLAVYLFADFGRTAADINSQNEQQELIKFNTRFSAYEGREGLTIYDVITVASYANENNLYYNDSLDEHKVIICLDSISNEIQDDIETKKINLIETDKNFINSNNLSLPTYSCKIVKYRDNGRVSTILFKKI